MNRYVYDSKKTKRYRFPTHTNELVIDRSESAGSEVFMVVLQPGEAPPMHQHDDTEQVFYIIEGDGRLEIGADAQAFEVKPGDVCRIPPATLHRIHCTGAGALQYLAIDCFPAGRPTHEPTWDSHVKGVCKQQGWDYEKVVNG
jgi:mannose-6-phosphate isomerase-like protein (cupin superfamily)